MVLALLGSLRKVPGMKSTTETHTTGRMALVFLPRKLSSEMQAAGFSRITELAKASNIHRNSLPGAVVAGIAEASPKVIASVASALQVHPARISDWGWVG